MKLTKEKLKKADKLLDELPMHLKEIVLLKTFDKMALMCYEDSISYKNFCTEDKEILCKQILIDFEFTNELEKWPGRYHYLVENIMKLLQIISKKENKPIKNLKSTFIVNYINGPKIFDISEEDYKKIYKKVPLDVIDFILLQKTKIKFDKNIDQQLFKTIEKADLKELDKLLYKYFISQNTKNSGVIVAIEKYISQPHSGTVFDSFNNNYIKIIEQLAQVGADKGVILEQFKKYKISDFMQMYSFNPQI